MSLKELSEYTNYSKYARYLPEKKRRETWTEEVNRVFDMHERKFADIIKNDEEFKNDFYFAKNQQIKKRVLGSQRNLQFGGPQIEKHNAKGYNCSFSHCDRLNFFSEAMYLLLCGCGVGFSVQKQHVAKLPKISNKNHKNEIRTHVIDDSIEGWSDAIDLIVRSYTNNNQKFEFDYSKIRPEGSIISGGFKAPGPKSLECAIEKIREVIDKRLENGEDTLRPIDCYDIVCHASDAVLSGGVRRSALICLFSFDDDEMVTAKTGNWFIDNPQRGRSNNSVVLNRKTTKFEDFKNIIEKTKQYGEPGFFWTDNEEIGTNPCVEIGLYPKTKDGRSGFQFCNLCTINAKKCKDEESFLQACRASAIIGTIQASYTNFKYLTKETQEITENEALLGCSITGIMDNPEILLNEELQRKGAEEIKRKNQEIAQKIGIKAAARTTCIKPEGTSSVFLQTSSGIHPQHAKRYIRNVQANRNEFPAKYFESINPMAVEKSVWSNSGTDVVISFCCEVPQGSITKNQLGGVELLEIVKKFQKNWVMTGTNKQNCMIPEITHNVSNTITVKCEEWDPITEYIYENRDYFAGISLLKFSGDKDYPQAPFLTVFNPKEMIQMYGDATVFASGLIVDGLHAFKNNLWDGCMHALTDGEYIEKYEIDEFRALDWIRRVKQFADRYFEGNVEKVTYLLKDVATWKKWVDLNREYSSIDWSEVVEEKESLIDVNTMGAQACSGGKCEL